MSLFLFQTARSQCFMIFPPLSFNTRALFHIVCRCTSHLCIHHRKLLHTVELCQYCKQCVHQMCLRTKGLNALLIWSMNNLVRHDFWFKKHQNRFVYSFLCHSCWEFWPFINNCSYKDSLLQQTIYHLCLSRSLSQNNEGKMLFDDTSKKCGIMGFIDFIVKQPQLRIKIYLTAGRNVHRWSNVFVKHLLVVLFCFFFCCSFLLPSPVLLSSGFLSLAGRGFLQSPTLHSPAHHHHPHQQQHTCLSSTQVIIAV